MMCDCWEVWRKLGSRVESSCKCCNMPAKHVSAVKGTLTVQDDSLMESWQSAHMSQRTVPTMNFVWMHQMQCHMHKPHRRSCQTSFHQGLCRACQLWDALDGLPLTRLRALLHMEVCCIITVICVLLP